MPLIYGINAAREALRAEGARAERLTVQRGQAGARLQEIIALARASHVPVVFEEKSSLDRRSGGARHQGVLVQTGEIEVRTVEEILAGARTPGLLVVLDGIEDPHNLGAILRSAEVAGADAVLVPRRRAAPVTATVVKASAGAASHLPIGRFGNTARLLEDLKERGYWIAGLATDAGQPPWESDFTASVALVLGGEGSGLHRLVRERCDYLVAIPVRGHVASYNVSVAAGIVLYEVLRQRSKTHG